MSDTPEQDAGIPEPIPDRPDAGDATGEISMLAPEEAEKVVAEIRAIAETRGEDSEVIELVELQPSGPLAPSRASRGPTRQLQPITDDELAAPAPVEDEGLSAEELRDAWPLLDLDERGDGLRVLPREDAEDFFVSLPASDQAALLLHFRPGQRRQWMRMLEPDDVADVVQYAGEENKQTLLALLDVPTRKEVNALLAYAEDEAGGLMSTRYARLRPAMTADEAVSYLRRQARDKIETIYYAYVLDPELHLLGVVSFRDLFAADPKKTVADVMETDVVRVSDETDQETVSRIFAEHDLTVVPVVDSEGKMKGIVTVDDIVDVVQEEATEDAQKFGGMEALELPYLQSSRREMIMKRGRWLVLLLVGSMLTTTAMESFGDQIARVPVLSVFIAMIVSTGGNSGSQASTLVIRAMALGEVRAADWWLILRRELAIGFALGGVLFIVAFLRVLIWGSFGAYAGPYGDPYVMIALAVGISVIGCTTCGTLAGAMLPFVLKKFGADPASASAPFVATLVDVSGILIYFGIANLILSRVLPL
jgi:magnesium transporter